MHGVAQRGLGFCWFSHFSASCSSAAVFAPIFQANMSIQDCMCHQVDYAYPAAVPAIFSNRQSLCSLVGRLFFFQALFSIAPIFSLLSAQSAIMRHWRDWGAPQVKRRPRLSAISYHCFTKWNLRYTIFARIINFTSHIAYFTKIESTDACLV